MAVAATLLLGSAAEAKGPAMTWAALNGTTLEVPVQETSMSNASGDQEGGVRRTVGLGMAGLVGGAVFLMLRRRRADH